MDGCCRPSVVPVRSGPCSDTQARHSFGVASMCSLGFRYWLRQPDTFPADRTKNANVRTALPGSCHRLAAPNPERSRTSSCTRRASSNRARGTHMCTWLAPQLVVCARAIKRASRAHSHQISTATHTLTGATIFSFAIVVMNHSTRMVTYVSVKGRSDRQTPSQAATEEGERKWSTFWAHSRPALVSNRTRAHAT